MLSEIKTKSISEKIEECYNYTKKLYGLVNCPTGRKPDNPFPEYTDQQAMANEFTDYFIGKITKICDSLEDNLKYIPRGKPKGVLSHSRSITEMELIWTINGMPTKSCEYDAIPTGLLKKILPSIAKTLTHIGNVSLEKGILATRWKTVIIWPLLKKTGLKLLTSNYRPVSNLVFLSKAREKVVLEQFTANCDEFKMMPDYQSAYKRNYSCETSLVKVVNDILWCLERQEVCAYL